MMADDIKDKAESLASDVKDTASDVADTAKDIAQATQMADHIAASFMVMAWPARWDRRSIQMAIRKGARNARISRPVMPAKELKD